MLMLPRLLPLAALAIKVTAGLAWPACKASTDTRTAACLPRVRRKAVLLAFKFSTCAKSMLPRVKADTVPALTAMRSAADSITSPVAEPGADNSSWLALALTIRAGVLPTDAELTWSRLLPCSVTDKVPLLTTDVIDVTATLAKTL